MPNILVVGGAGYIGTTLVPELLKLEGYHVVVLDTFLYGENVFHAYQGDRLTLHRGTMSNIPASLLSGMDVVVNLGGLSNDPTANYNPQANWELNHKAAIRLAQQCKSMNVPRYVFASSCSLYDRQGADESMDVLLTETAPITPIGYYALAKYAAENDLLAMADDQFHVVILRVGTVHGYSERMRMDLVVNTMVADSLVKGYITLHGGGETWRPLVEVRDVAAMYLKAIRAEPDRVRNQIFNMVGQNLRISEVGLRVQHVLQAHGVNTAIHTDYSRPASRNYRVSGEKAKTLLGFTSTISIEESVDRIVTHLKTWSFEELTHPRHFNIRWMTIFEEMGTAASA